MSSAEILPDYWEKQQYRAYRRADDEDEIKRELEEMREHENIIWAHGKKYDKLAPRINKMIDDIENQCQQIISNPSYIRKVIRTWRNKFRSKGSAHK